MTGWRMPQFCSFVPVWTKIKEAGDKATNFAHTHSYLVALRLVSLLPKKENAWLYT